MIVFLLSVFGITFNIQNFEVENVNDFIEIIREYKNKNTEKMFNYLNFDLIITLKLFNLIPIFIIKLNEKKIQNLISKTKGKMNTQIQTKIAKFAKINKAEINISIGMGEADITALFVGLLDVIFSFIYTGYYCYFESELDYNVKPVYGNEVYLNMIANLKITFSSWYKNPFMVNNTNKKIKGDLYERLSN